MRAGQSVQSRRVRRQLEGRAKCTNLTLGRAGLASLGPVSLELWCPETPASLSWEHASYYTRFQLPIIIKHHGINARYKKHTS